MFEEKIIQISGNRALTNRGKLFELFEGYNGTFWSEVTLPDFNESKQDKKLKGKPAQFIESKTQQEKFDEANKITDLLNE